jgi:hypothetical protein
MLVFGISELISEDVNVGVTVLGTFSRDTSSSDSSEASSVSSSIYWICLETSHLIVPLIEGNLGIEVFVKLEPLSRKHKALIAQYVKPPRIESAAGSRKFEDRLHHELHDIGHPKIHARNSAEHY